MTQFSTLRGCGGRLIRLKKNTPPNTWFALKSMASSSPSKSSNSSGSGLTKEKVEEPISIYKINISSKKLKETNDQ